MRDHYVNFRADSVTIEHPLGDCRDIANCSYNEAIAEVYDEETIRKMDGLLGRWRITDIDSEGLPSLERAD